MWHLTNVLFTFSHDEAGGASEIKFKENIPMEECVVEIFQWVKAFLVEWSKDSRQWRMKMMLMFMNAYKLLMLVLVFVEFLFICFSFGYYYYYYCLILTFIAPCFPYCLLLLTCNDRSCGFRSEKMCSCNGDRWWLNQCRFASSTGPPWSWPASFFHQARGS